MIVDLEKEDAVTIRAVDIIRSHQENTEQGVQAHPVQAVLDHIRPDQDLGHVIVV